MENIKDFTNWLNSFLLRNGGFSPFFMERWFNKVQKEHIGIRYFIGGVRKSLDIELKAQQKELRKEEVEQTIKKLMALSPEYLKAYNFDDTVFLNPSIRINDHNLIKTSKHYLTYVSKYFGCSETNKRAEKLIQQLGDAWARNRITDINLNITLTTSAKSFALLGHLGPDQTSCFRQGSDKDRQKWAVAQTMDSFVLLIEAVNEESGKVENLFRSFGFVSNGNFKIFNLANCYFDKRLKEGDAVEAIKIFFQKLFGCQENEVFFAENLASVKGCYHNECGNWTFSTVPPSQIQHNKEVMFVNIQDILQFICPKCGNEDGSNQNWQFIDGNEEIYCNRCVSRANLCEISGKRTFQPLVEGIKSNGILYNIHKDLALECAKCEECNIVTIDVKKHSEKANVCCGCKEAHYGTCDVCQNLIKDEDLLDINDNEELVCRKCLEGNYEKVEETIFSELSYFINGIKETIKSKEEDDLEFYMSSDGYSYQYKKAPFSWINSDDPKF